MSCGKLNCDCQLYVEKYHGFTIRQRICSPTDESVLYWIDGSGYEAQGAPMFFTGPYLCLTRARKAVDRFNLAGTTLILNGLKSLGKNCHQKNIEK